MLFTITGRVRIRTLPAKRVEGFSTEPRNGPPMRTARARISEEERNALDEVAELLGEDRNTTVRKALREGLQELRAREAVERYRAGDVSVNQAARIAGVSVAEWLEVARDRELHLQLDSADLEREAEAAREL